MDRIVDRRGNRPEADLHEAGLHGGAHLAADPDEAAGSARDASQLNNSTTTGKKTARVSTIPQAFARSSHPEMRMVGSAASPPQKK